jgi:hypothetical protein
MPKVVKQTMKPRKKQASSMLSAWPEDSGIKINLYGRSGTGKTTLWATFPGPILALICSGGRKPGELRSIDTPEYRKKITPVIVRASTDIAKILNDGVDEYKTLVLDHGSGLQDLVLKEILGLDELPPQLSWGLATQQDYGQCSLQMKEILRALLSQSQNVVIVAQERDFNTDGGSDSLVLPYVASALSPSVVGWLNPAVDYIGQTFIRPRMVKEDIKIGGKKKSVTRKGKGVEYCLRTAPDSVYTTKFRLPKGRNLPDVIVDPSYAKLEALIKG